MHVIEQGREAIEAYVNDSFRYYIYRGYALASCGPLLFLYKDLYFFDNMEEAVTLINSWLGDNVRHEVTEVETLEGYQYE
jgi:hypothetical protein